jgi:branched-chain amino acid aminotransferase
MAFAWLNGSLCDVDDARLSILDTGLQHGAGVFTTMRARPAGVVRIEPHLHRVRSSCTALSIPLMPTDAELIDAVEELLLESSLKDARIRLTVTRGHQIEDPEHGLVLSPSIFITANPIENYPAELYDKGMTLAVCDSQKANPYDIQAGHKTLSYVSRFAALHEAHQRGCNESAWFNVHNFLQSGSISNIFLVRAGELFTPPTNADLLEDAVRNLTPYPRSNVLPGITRAAVIEVAARESIKLTRAGLNIDDLLSAEEVFLTNSVMGVMPVCRIERKGVGEERPGPITRKLIKWVEELE